ncbi:hypothetical protein PSM36_0598 [Proteiniphilum saccharofermentans]|uniref:DUF5063 domain-containing protein n=1 Tax=Proteiniphilum saccharofermentans TaxID=1642647 RepID=A0A1R3T2K7_9BACT|nr:MULTISPECIES: DUF5063 domain-containing protein [Proteiniphilum]MDY9917336.1 DUF5063 domain-containing protein [Proteiniphilum sp.]SCD19428.1 hypothetical protein PSM36_0598 [Proteiniphilum saccharofermentans]
MERADIDKIVYDKSVIDFVTIAVEVCVFLEKNEPLPREEWVDRLLKMLPLLYVKALLLPGTVSTEEEVPATFVREEDYSRVANMVSEVMGEEDVYLDVFVEDMKYSDTPVSTFISENIADIYQDIRNFVSVYQFGLTGQMNDALYQCSENFRLYWGQKLVNVLRPLHTLKCLSLENENDEADLSEDELWG